MNRTKCAFLTSMSAVLIAVLLGCTDRESPVRPVGVPEDAVLVSGSKTGWWQRCAVQASEVACQIWNANGLSLENGAFLPYDAPKQVSPQELKIASTGGFAGPDWIVLEDGRILLPRRRYDELKAFLDRAYKSKKSQ